MVRERPGTRNNIFEVAAHLCKVKGDEEFEVGADSFGDVIGVSDSLALPFRGSNVQGYSISVRGVLEMRVYFQRLEGKGAMHIPLA